MNCPAPPRRDYARLVGLWPRIAHSTMRYLRPWAIGVCLLYGALLSCNSRLGDSGLSSASTAVPISAQPSAASVVAATPLARPAHTSSDPRRLVDPASRRTPTEFPTCPVGTHRLSQRSQDNTLRMLCAKNGAARLTPHGPSWHWLASGQLKQVEHYKDGLEHGSTTGWYANGVRQFQGEFTLGKRLGEWTSFHRNGALEEVAHYERGYREGSRRRFYDSGRKSLEAQYAHGDPVGLWNAFYDNDSVQPALVASCKGDANPQLVAGFLPDGTPWNQHHSFADCLDSKACGTPLHGLDIEALPRVLVQHCAYHRNQVVPRSHWARVLRESGILWTSALVEGQGDLAPTGCVEGISILACAVDLDGSKGSEVIAELRYRAYAPDCKYAWLHRIGPTQALAILSPPRVGESNWHSFGTIGYRRFDAAGVESPEPASIIGFVLLPHGGTGVRTCESRHLGECLSRPRTEHVWAIIEGRLKHLVSRTRDE